VVPRHVAHVGPRLEAGTDGNGQHAHLDRR
jgi:hypothetical protein